MIATLPELIAPLSEKDFSEILRTRRLMLLRSPGVNRFADLLNWDAFRKAIESDSYPPEKLHVTLNTERVLSILYQQRGKIDPERFATLAQKGASFIANDIDCVVPALAVLCSDIGARLEEKVSFTAVMTTGRSGAFKRHFDRADIGVFQLTGSKRWRIYGPAVAYPEKGMLVPPVPQGTPFFDEMLHEGDFLFLPGGHWHDCENGPGHSLHLSLLLEPITGYAALHAILGRVIEEELFRVPFARMEKIEDRIAHEAALKARLIELVTNAPLLDCRTGAKHTGAKNEEF